MTPGKTNVYCTEYSPIKLAKLNFFGAIEEKTYNHFNFVFRYVVANFKSGGNQPIFFLYYTTIIQYKDPTFLKILLLARDVTGYLTLLLRVVFVPLSLRVGAWNVSDTFLKLVKTTEKVIFWGFFLHGKI